MSAPALFAVARGDRYVPVTDMRTVARRARSATKRLIVLPATAGHGWDMLFGTRTEWSPLAATVAAFIRRHAGDQPDTARPEGTVTRDKRRRWGRGLLRSLEDGASGRADPFRRPDAQVSLAGLEP